VTNKTTIGSLKVAAEQVNQILAEIGVDIDASISGVNSKVRLDGFNGSKPFSQGYVPKIELRTAILAIQAVLYEVSRQLRVNGEEVEQY